MSVAHILRGMHSPRAQAHRKPKLTETAVREIRAQAGQASSATLARRYGVSATLVQSVIRREAWSSVLDQPLKPIVLVPAYSDVRILDPEDETRVLRVIPVDELRAIRAKCPVIPEQPAPYVEPASPNYSLVAAVRRRKASLTHGERYQAMVRTKRAASA